MPTLSLNVPFTQTLTANTYTEFTVPLGRNLLITIDGDVYYHPSGSGLDGQAVDSTEQFRWIGPGTDSLRLGGSGVGAQALPAPTPVNPDGTVSFALAGYNAGVTVWLLVVAENVAGGR